MYENYFTYLLNIEFSSTKSLKICILYINPSLITLFDFLLNRYFHVYAIYPIEIENFVNLIIIICLQFVFSITFIEEHI